MPRRASALVIGSHGMVLTAWLVHARGAVAQHEAGAFWAALAFPGMVPEYSEDERRRMPRTVRVAGQMKVDERNGVSVDKVPVVLNEPLGQSELQSGGVRLQDHGFNPLCASGSSPCEFRLEVGGAVALAALLGQDADDQRGNRFAF